MHPLSHDWMFGAYQFHCATSSAKGGTHTKGHSHATSSCKPQVNLPCTIEASNNVECPWNKREIREREGGSAEGVLNYRSVMFQILPLNCMRGMFSSSDCTYCMFIKISECVSGMCISECFSLRVSDQEKKKSQWMCVLNVFHDCTGLNTHTYAHRRGVCVRFFFYASVEQCTLVSFECSVVNGVPSRF